MPLSRAEIGSVEKIAGKIGEKMGEFKNSGGKCPRCSTRVARPIRFEQPITEPNHSAHGKHLDQAHDSDSFATYLEKATTLDSFRECKPMLFGFRNSRACDLNPGSTTVPGGRVVRSEAPLVFLGPILKT